MIKQLRRKFIIIAMCSLFAVLAAVISAINVVNYVNVARNADEIVSVLKEGGGMFGDLRGNRMSPETPYQTRFFTVVLNAQGETVDVNDKDIAAIDAPEAEGYARELFLKGKTQGFYKNYRYGVIQNQIGVMYIFVDCTQELNNFYSFLWASIIVSAAGLFLVFVLLCIFSGRATRPFVENYERQKRFITDAGHEIKTPLTIIGADADVLQMQGGANEWTESIKEQVKRLSSLTEKLVFLARTGEEGKPINATDFCLSDAVEETVQTFSAVAMARGLQLNVCLQPNLTYCGDEALIRQLVSLLTDNALKYAQGGSVNISLSSAGNKYRISVINRAPDLQGNLELLFERFYRGDSSRNSETGGHGVGLSVARAIVAAHKGKISAAKEGENVVFTVVL